MPRRTFARFSPHAAAFVLALASTLVIFSGVDRLASTAQPTVMLVQGQSGPAQG
jgi:hypothetical protein